MDISTNELSNDFNDEEKTKIWIKALLGVYRVIPNIIHAIDRMINVQASQYSFMANVYNGANSTADQIECVIDMSQRKQKLIRLYRWLKVVYDNMDFDSREFIEKRFIDDYTVEELSEEYQISIRTVYRRTNKIIDDIYHFFMTQNWNLEYIESRIENEDWINERFEYYKNNK